MAKIGHNQPQFSVNSLSDTDRKNIKKSVDLMVDSLTHIAAQQDLIKGEAEALYVSLGMPQKLAKKLAKAKFKASFDNESEEFRVFETMFETVVK
jgi:glucokinase